MKLSDIAEVRRGYEDPATFLVHHNGEPALMLDVVMQDQFNGLDLGKALEAEQSKLQKALPVGFTFEKVIDQADVIRNAVDEFQIKFFVALLVVMVVSLLSLGWRVGIVVAAAIFALRDRLPAGLTIPRAAAIRDLDAGSAALWLEQVPARRVAWDLRRHARAAYLLGRLAASRAVAPLATAVHGTRTPRVYADTWLSHVVLPALTGNGAWAHPLVRDVFDARLRRRLLAAADALPALLDELDDAPAATAHGDACTANLLAAGDRDALVMVDLGFCGTAPLGTDLGQLIVGEVQAG